MRFAGADRYWDGWHEFGKLSPREAQRAQPARIGPRHDELGVFATFISRIRAAPTPGYEQALRALGDGPITDLVHELEHGGEVTLLTAMEADAALAHLWPRFTSCVNSSEPF